MWLCECPRGRPEKYFKDYLDRKIIFCGNPMSKRESGFNLTGLQAVKLKEYNALYDPNMKHFFESKNNQLLLYRTGQIDSNGRVIDLDKNKSKLFILEREFKEAEKIEERRQKEELEMRVSLCIPMNSQ